VNVHTRKASTPLNAIEDAENPFLPVTHTPQHMILAKEVSQNKSKSLEVARTLS